MTVPNKFPNTPPTTHRLAVIGEAPGEDDITAGEPFSGTSGRLLRAVLASNGLSTDQLFFGNITQHRPPANDISKLKWSGAEIQSGLAQLHQDLSVFNPHCCLLVGRVALKAFHPAVSTDDGETIPIGNLRGSIFQGTGQFPYKAVAAYDPAYILRCYGDIPFFRADVARAVQESLTPELSLPTRVGNLRPTLSDVLTFIDDIRKNHTPVAFDIEGCADSTGVTMVSICPDAHSGIVIPFWVDSRHYWSELDEPLVWSALANLLADPLVPKTAHNCFYEIVVLAWRHRCLIRNLAYDTMMLCWENAPELERGLGVVSTLYTREPFYKDERDSDGDRKLLYNFKDSAVTAEIRDNVLPSLTAFSAGWTSPSPIDHYNFNINLIPAMSYLQLRGCKLDLAKLQELKDTTTAEINALNAEIEGSLLRPFNVKSYKDKQWYLFDVLGLKPSSRYGKSTKEDILLQAWHKTEDPILRLIIRAIRKRTRLSDLNKLVCNQDGRIRSSYDLVGTNTGRLSSRSSSIREPVREELKTIVKQYWDDSGTNLQNVTKDLRVCFIPDSEEFDFYQCDLAGADGWTVSADLAAYGFPTMLEDYLAGIKPALVLNVMLREYEAGRNPNAINLLPREEIRKKCKELKASYDAHEGVKLPDGRPYDWQYFCCKKIQHGSNYGAAPAKIAELIFADSDATISISARQAALYQSYYKSRYKTDVRNEKIRQRLCDQGYLVAACGVRRQFFGIRSRARIDDATVREASAFEPQANTTWATNRALERLWFDPSNRTSRGALFVEPLLQIHDALSGQYRVKNRAFAHERLGEWFKNPLVINGIDITIPADGQWGKNWKATYTPLGKLS